MPLLQNVVVLLSIMLPALSPAAESTETTAPTFAQAIHPREWAFPRDHRQHPEFQTEWWYFTGNLKNKKRDHFGYQFTIFRRALKPHVSPSISEWRTRDMYLAHIALTDVSRKKYFYDEEASRPALGLAGSSTETLHVWLPAASVEETSSGIRVRAKSSDFKYDLLLNSVKPPALNGEGGLDAKGPLPGQASYYYSVTRMETSGTVETPTGRSTVSGLSWMDHEFGSNQLGENQVGWDWFALQLSDGSDLMLYHMRLKDGSIDPTSGGTFVDATGKAQTLTLADIEMNPTREWTSKKSGATYPIEWQILIPSLGINIKTRPMLREQELTTEASTNVTYWEGCIEVNGQRNGTGITGFGYMELTGYKEQMSGRI